MGDAAKARPMTPDVAQGAERTAQQRHGKVFIGQGGRFSRNQQIGRSLSRDGEGAARRPFGARCAKIASGGAIRTLEGE
ncbi:hypothetical protein Sa4125_04950 [Aureimonas sp. SA4125]|nr:hypothetical protein Sa4125_04950 [Aureimonas sp. SA4125]